MPESWKRARQVLVLGCGSSQYLGAFAAQVWHTRLGRFCRALPASEFLLRPDSYIDRGNPPLVIGISRTGETSETLLALTQARDRHGLAIVPVTCAPDSPIGRLSENTLTFPEVAEQGIVMTRAFIGILACFLDSAGCGREVRKLPALVRASLDKHQQTLISLANRDFDHVVFLGTGPFYQIAREAALKVREMSASHAEAHQLFEFRHGLHATLGPGSLVWVMTGPRDVPFLPGVFPELRALGAELLVTGVGLHPSLVAEADLSLSLDGAVGATEVEALGLLHLAQLFALFRTVRLGGNPDQPRNVNRVTPLHTGASRG
jgi:glucosamine--fructose-6-phosphate aminotransferase (isomerizing)